MDAAALAAVFAQTTSPDPTPRKAAEEYLQRAALQPGFGVALLQLAAAPGVDEHVRQAVAVAFKNHVKFQWAPPEAEAGAPQPPALGTPEKEQLKGAIVAVMLAQPPRIQAQLSEALALMAASDFPERWPTLLPEMLSRLTPDVAVVNGVLAACDTVFRRFRHQYDTVELVADIKYVLALLVDPLLELFKATGARLAGAEGAVPDAARQLLTTVLHTCRIFYSLNYQDMPGAQLAAGARAHGRSLATKFHTPSSCPLTQAVTHQRSLRTTWPSGWASSKSIWRTKTPRWWRATRRRRVWSTRHVPVPRALSFSTPSSDCPDARMRRSKLQSAKTLTCTCKSTKRSLRPTSTTSPWRSGACCSRHGRGRLRLARGDAPEAFRCVAPAGWLGAE